jgi:hypothetical protein
MDHFCIHSPRHLGPFIESFCTHWLLLKKKRRTTQASDNRRRGNVYFEIRCVEGYVRDPSTRVIYLDLRSQQLQVFQQEGQMTCCCRDDEVWSLSTIIKSPDEEIFGVCKCFTSTSPESFLLVSSFHGDWAWGGGLSVGRCADEETLGLLPALLRLPFKASNPVESITYLPGFSQIGFNASSHTSIFSFFFYVTLKRVIIT